MRVQSHSAAGNLSTAMRGSRAHSPAAASPRRHSGGPDTFTNPIIRTGNTPDPTVIQWGHDKHGHKLYEMVTTTEGTRRGLQLRQSTDLVHWKKIGTVFNRSNGLKWSHSTRFWAPEIYHQNGKFVVYFAAQAKDTGKMCIGMAESKSITGPWHDPLGHPLLKPHDKAGQESFIDPVVLRDPKSKHLILYYVVQPGSIYAQRLDGNGKEVKPGARTLVLKAGDQVDASGKAVPNPPSAWESIINEGPEPFYKNGMYYMFYSGAWTQNGSYAIGVARSTSPFGPFEKRGAPILHGDSTFDGTGHNSRPVVGPDGKLYVLHHGYDVGHEQYSQRHLFLEPLTMGPDGWPRLGKDEHPVEGRQRAP